MVMGRIFSMVVRRFQTCVCKFDLLDQRCLCGGRGSWWITSTWISSWKQIAKSGLSLLRTISCSTGGSLTSHCLSAFDGLT